MPLRSSYPTARPLNSSAQGCPLLTTVCRFLWNLPWAYDLCRWTCATHRFYFQSAQSSSSIVWRSLIIPRHSALPFKRSPLFLESGQEVHTSLSTGVLSLPISSSVLLLKPKELQCYQRRQWHFWPFHEHKPPLPHSWGQGTWGNPPLLWDGSPAFIHFKHLGFM